jgi:hypothetical protein
LWAINHLNCKYESISNASDKGKGILCHVKSRNTKGDNKMENLKRAFKVFSVLGQKPKDFHNNKFSFYLLKNWETPSFSPLILNPGHNLTKNDLNYIENYFYNHPITNHSLKTFPYFNFFHDPNNYDFNLIESLCRRCNWTIDLNPLRVNLLEHPLVIDLPDAQQYYEIYQLTERDLHNDYKQLLRLNFNADNKYIEYVKQIYNTTRFYSWTVLIRSLNGACIGGGTVSIRNKIAFLTWGCVKEPYRNQGFHYSLLAGCKMIATSYNAYLCGYTTRNQFILNKSDITVEMYICRKIA